MTYHSLPGVNFSTLKHIARSPAAYRHVLDQSTPDTAALAMGRAVHCLVFEPLLFERDFAIYEGERRAGDAWKTFQSEHAGRTILKAPEADEAAALANAVRTHPLVAPYLRDGRFEVPLQWTDEATGIGCKGLVDWLTPGVLLDLKTSRTIEARPFGGAAARYRYPAQLAFYRRGAIANGYDVQRVLLVAVEKSAPYDVGVFELDAEALAVGDADCDAWLARLKECRECDEWPGRYTEEQALQLPGWLFLDDEDDENDPNTFGLE